MIDRSECIKKIIDLNHVKKHLESGEKDEIVDTKISRLGVNKGNIGKRIDVVREKLNNDDHN